MRKKVAVLLLSIVGLLYLRPSKTGERILPLRSGAARSDSDVAQSAVAKSLVSKSPEVVPRKVVEDRKPASVDREQELKDLLACWRGRACYADGSDAKAAHLELVDVTEKYLRSMQQDRALLSEKKMSALIELYALADERVRRVLTEIFMRQNISDEVLSLYEHELEFSFSDGNLTLALEDLKRYSGNPEYAGRVENEVGKLILHGSSLASVEVAKQILPFLNTGNIVFFEKIRDQLPEGSEKRENLTLNFQEYYRLKSGG